MYVFLYTQTKLHQLETVVTGRSDLLVEEMFLLVVWRCALIMHGGQSAMQDLEPMKLGSFVVN